MQVQIKSRWSSRIIFEADVDASLESDGLRLGAAVKLAYKSGADLSGADLRGAVLSGAVLRGAVLRGAVLSGAVLRGADLSGAVLSGADLSDAVLRDAVLRGAVLSGAVLSGADLSGAVLRGADLSDAVLSGADLSGAVLSGAVLSCAVLSDAVLRGAVLRGRKVVSLIARVTRNDGWEFFGWRFEDGDRVIAGCRDFTLAEFRAHVERSYPNTSKARETLAILDFIERRFADTPVEAALAA